MQIAKHKVATIDYTLTDDDGRLIDSSEGKAPFSFIQGIGSIIAGLENALEGKTSGDSLNVTIAPEHGYGVRDEGLEQVVPKDVFEGIDELKVGMQFQTPTEEGAQVVTVVNIEDDNVTVDGNHPLAGVTLNFEVTVVDVRDATGEELDHGHVHG
ncbi:MAG: peptidylprolyl isomerase [Gammaproteobacteria bacterium]